MASDIVLPFSGQSVTIIGMTGVEEDLLLDDKKMADGRAVNHVMRNCASINGERPAYEDIVAMKTADRQTLMLAVREESYGDLVQGTIRCRECKTRLHIEVRISGVESYPRARNEYDENGLYSFSLSDGTVITNALLDGKMEQLLAKAPSSEQMTQILLIPLRRIQAGAQTSGTFRLDASSYVQQNDHKKWLLALPAKFRQEMREALEAWAFGPDTRFSKMCDECGAENIGAMESLQGFFFPSRRSEATEQ